MALSSLAGKTALVSGAGSGIGRAVALKLSHHGCNVGLFDLSEKGSCQVIMDKYDQSIIYVAA